MARDKVTYESYEQDVFDNPPKGPVGVHRGSRSVISRIAPFVIVILVAALCGFGAWAWVTGEYKNILNLNTSSQTAQTSNTEKKDSSDAKSDSADSSDTKSENTDSSNAQSDSAATDNADQSAQQDQAAATVNKATQVRVINATGISGYAGRKADVLQTAGYTSVEPRIRPDRCRPPPWCGTRMKRTRPPPKMWLRHLASVPLNRFRGLPLPSPSCC